MPSLSAVSGRFSLLSMGTTEDEGTGLATPTVAMQPLAEAPDARAERQSVEIYRALQIGARTSANPLSYRNDVIAMTRSMG